MIIISSGDLLCNVSNTIRDANGEPVFIMKYCQVKYVLVDPKKKSVTNTATITEFRHYPARVYKKIENNEENCITLFLGSSPFATLMTLDAYNKEFGENQALN